jgi:hypothetical protein
VYKLNKKCKLFRDSPDELPSFVASNDANENNRFKICGDNLFAGS